MLAAFGQTHIGRRRKLNEDSILVDTKLNFYAVCDGMGGHNAGDVASQMAIESLEAFIRKSAGNENHITWPYGLEASLSFEANRLKTALKIANERVYRTTANQGAHTGMGSTAVLALVSKKTLTVASAGDSRCYMFRRQQLEQLTRDDSWASTAWAEGILSRDEIDKHPLRKVLTKAVGAKDDIDVETVEHTLVPGDVVLLCSDGLHSMIGREQILLAVTPFPQSLEEAAQKLVTAANDAGGKDNISVVLLRYTE